MREIARVNYFFCEKCKYQTFDKACYNKHLKTDKHKKEEKQTNATESAEESEYEDVCHY